MRLSSPVRPGEPLLVVAVEEEAVDVTSRYPVLVTGVGKLRAGVAVASVLAGADKPSVVINFGTAGALVDLAGRYLLGDAPFAPGEVAGPGDYDQLMRRDEWFGRGEGE